MSAGVSFFAVCAWLAVGFGLMGLGLKPFSREPGAPNGVVFAIGATVILLPIFCVAVYKLATLSAGV